MEKDIVYTTKMWIVTGTILLIFAASISIYCYILYEPQQSVPLIIQPQIIEQKTNLTKLIQTKQPKIDPVTAKEIATTVEKYAKQYKFPPELIICIISRESSFRPILTSSANCKGLMQINEKFHKEKLKKLNIKSVQLFHIDHNIHIGCMVLREYYNKTKTISGALTKYVGGNHKTYISDILADFTDLMIIQNNFK